MTPEKLDELYELAKKATRGPWKVCKYLGQRSDEWSVSLDTDKGQGIAVVQTMYEYKNAAYIAAASPDVVTALIDRVRELEEGLKVMIEKFMSDGEADQSVADAIDLVEPKLREARAALNKE